MRRAVTFARASLLGAGLLVAGAVQAQPASHRHQATSPAQKEQQAFEFLGLKMFVEVDSADTKGTVATVRVFVPPGAGAPPHVHSREDEVH
uniref:hypothetical protein n=1 Tax=Phenylobacterium sp. TaxID=1871053 RepID=UPI0039838150